MNITQKIGYNSTPLSEEKLIIASGIFFTMLALLYFVGLNWFGLFDVDEAIFTQTSVEMLESRNYIAPTYNGEPRYHKPPLIYWFQALSLNTFGTNSLIGARLPSALFSFASVLMFFLFLKNSTGQTRFALTASAILGLNLSWLVITRAATADAALNFFILAGSCTLLSLLYVRASLFKQALAGFLLAGGMLAKGPIALFVPGVITLLAWFIKPGGIYRNITATNPFVIGGALIAGILPWIVAMISLNGWAFFKEFWLIHNWGRFTGDLGNSHSSSGLYYVWVLLLGFFPWVFLALKFALNLNLSELAEKLRSSNPNHAWPLIGLIWGISVMALFSFSGTKLAHYIVPALPGFALFIAGGIEKLPTYYFSKFYAFIMLVFTLFLATIFIFLNPILILLRGASQSEPSALFDWLKRLFGFKWPPEDALTVAVLSQDITLNWAPYVIGFILILGIWQGFSVTMRGFRHGIATLAISMWLILYLVIAGIVPVVDAYTQASLRHLANIIKDEASHTPTTKIYHLGLHKPSVRWLSGQSFTGLDSAAPLKTSLPIGQSIILYETDKFDSLKKSLPNNAIWQTPVCEGGYCVLKISRKLEN